jgi:hypothetical protein
VSANMAVTQINTEKWSAVGRGTTNIHQRRRPGGAVNSWATRSAWQGTEFPRPNPAGQRAADGKRRIGDVTAALETYRQGADSTAKTWKAQRDGDGVQAARVATDS